MVAVDALVVRKADKNCRDVGRVKEVLDRVRVLVKWHSGQVSEWRARDLVAYEPYMFTAQTRLP